MALDLLGVGGTEQDDHGQHILGQFKGAGDRFVKKTPADHVPGGQEHERDYKNHARRRGVVNDFFNPLAKGAVDSHFFLYFRWVGAVVR